MTKIILLKANRIHSRKHTNDNEYKQTVHPDAQDEF